VVVRYLSGMSAPLPVGGQPFRAERPLPVEVVPARLVVGLLPDCQQAAARRGAKRVTRSAS
jgi:hypothetical protein